MRKNITFCRSISNFKLKAYLLLLVFLVFVYYTCFHTDTQIDQNNQLKPNAYIFKPRAHIEKHSCTAIRGWICMPQARFEGVEINISVGPHKYQHKFASPHTAPRNHSLDCASDEAHSQVFHVIPTSDCRAGQILSIVVSTTIDKKKLHYRLHDMKMKNHQHFISGNDIPIVLKHRQSLPIVINDTAPVRINILMCGVGYDLTGGPLSIFRFATLAALSGLNVRWINVDGAGISVSELRKHIKHYTGLEKFFDVVEFVFDGFHRVSIPTNSHDIFMATIYFTAFMAHATQIQLRNPNIIYFIQDYEPIFFPRNSDWVEATNSYQIPHFPIFSTFFLEDYFKANKIGLFKHIFTNPSAEQQRLFFSAQPAIRSFRPHSAVSSPTQKHRFFAYARPHAPRNAFELTIASISESVRVGVFDPVGDWEFFGLGAAADVPDECGLGGFQQVCLQMIRNIPENDYFELLSTGTVALSLMISPHPSLPPLDFANAGLLTVTNAMETKTALSFKRVSELIIVVEAELTSIVAGLRRAVVQSKTKTVHRSPINWATTWSDNRCYGDVLFGKIKHWMAFNQSLHGHFDFIST